MERAEKAVTNKFSHFNDQILSKYALVKTNPFFPIILPSW